MAMPQVANAFLMALCAVVYFAALVGLFRARTRLGIGAFFCALGVMHFIETYLAGNLYVPLPFGIVASPGSTVLFSGKLMLLLLVYIREDAAVVRQPIYGLLFGNLLLVSLAGLLRFSSVVSVGPDRVPDFGFLDQMGWLSIWSTVLLFADCILIVLLYERTRAWLGRRIGLRLWLSAAAVLTFDQLGFFTVLRIQFGVEPSVMVGGWFAKMAAAILYAALASAYLRWCERGTAPVEMRPALITDVFDILTYRERYEDLLARAGRDPLTGLRNRADLETEGRRRVEAAAARGTSIALLVVDIDHFKDFNDEHGHAAGDLVLRRVGEGIAVAIGPNGVAYRFGGEEFVVLCEGLTGTAALMLGEHLRARVAALDLAYPVTVSIGIATAPQEAAEYDSLFAIADHRLYQAKTAGRDRVVGGRTLEWSMPRGTQSA